MLLTVGVAACFPRGGAAVILTDSSSWRTPAQATSASDVRDILQSEPMPDPAGLRPQARAFVEGRTHARPRQTEQAESLAATPDM